MAVTRALNYAFAQRIWASPHIEQHALGAQSGAMATAERFNLLETLEMMAQDWVSHKSIKGGKHPNPNTNPNPKPNSKPNSKPNPNRIDSRASK